MDTLEREVAAAPIDLGTRPFEPRKPGRNKFVTLVKHAYQLVSLFIQGDSYIKYAELEGGELYGVRKIRTMGHGSESRLREVVEANGLNHQGRPNNDYRIIPDRMWMRENNADELPQFPQYVRDYFGSIMLGKKRVWQAAGTRPHTPDDWAVAIEKNKFGRNTAGFKAKTLNQGYGLIPAHLCSNKPINTPRRHAAIHRLHTRRIDQGYSNLPWVVQFFWNYFHGQRSS